MKKRVEYIDFIRMFAILSVIAIHVNAITRDGLIATNKIYYFFFTFLDSLTRAGVPLFLMLTGYFVLSSKKEESYKLFLKNKMPKLVIPFFIFSLAYYTYRIIDNSVNASILDFFVRFLNNDIYYHLWYMYVIIMIYILIPYTKKLVESLKEKELLRLIIITFILGNLFLTIQQFSQRFGFTLFQNFILPNFIIYNNYLLLGYYLNKYEFKNKKIIYILGIISLLLMPIADYFSINNNVRNDLMLTSTGILPVFYTLMIYYLIKENYHKLNINSRVKGIIVNFSQLSLYIYLSHVLIMNIIVKVINNYWIYDRFYEKVFFTAIVFSLTSILSYLFSILFDLMYNKIEVILQKNKKNI